jgi:hypothetical protein
MTGRERRRADATGPNRGPFTQHKAKEIIMIRSLRSIRTCLLVSLWIGLAAGCTKPSYIDVTYRLPDASDHLAGRQVALDVRDARSDQTIFSESTREEFVFFTGLFALSLSTGEKDYLAGTYDLAGLFREAFKQKLGYFGAVVIDAPQPGIPLIDVALKRFLLTKEKRKWIVDVSYEAQLRGDGRVLAMQTISGQGERTKIIGHGAAEKVISELFTDSINRFDFQKLFAEAAQ